LRDVRIDDLDLIVEAISSPNSGEERDYNRLEFLGDSVLKFCATAQVMAQHLNWPEVRDKWAMALHHETLADLCQNRVISPKLKKLL
jgi:dsRNA-specific ribonuclease